MNLQNIIAAGRMMAIVMVLLGAFRCGATLARAGECVVWDMMFGAALAACGLALTVMFPRSERRRGFGTAVLTIGSLVALMGVVIVSLAWHDPFSWMVAIVGIAIFIDALCLRISLSGRD